MARVLKKSTTEAAVGMGRDPRPGMARIGKNAPEAAVG
jgi:hypothetical protein